MKKTIVILAAFIILNGCAQYSSFMGPTYTMAKTGSVAHTGGAVLTSHGVKKITGKSPVDHLTNLTQNKERECITTHSSDLNEIFFETLDEIDCFIDPFSILK